MMATSRFLNCEGSRRATTMALPTMAAAARTKQRRPGVAGTLRAGFGAYAVNHLLKPEEWTAIREKRPQPTA
jgi:hypothetical protein